MCGILLIVPVLYYTVTIVNLVDANDMNTTQSSETRTGFSNLINGTFYTFSVTPVNRAGSGPTSTIIITTLTDEEGKTIYIHIIIMSVHAQYVC